MEKAERPALEGHVTGAGRAAEEPACVVVYLNRVADAAELRFVADAVRAAVAELDRRGAPTH